VILEWFNKTFDVFSRRNTEQRQGYKPDVLSERLRNQILFTILDVFAGKHADYGMRREDHAEAFLEHLHDSFQRLRGKIKLSTTPSPFVTSDVVAFLQTCEPLEFFDFIELAFKDDLISGCIRDENDLVEVINGLFRAEGAPYRLTPIVKREEVYTGNDSPFPWGRMTGGVAIRTVAWPRVVRAEEEVTHTEAVVPALTILADPAYAAANDEFRRALDDYRRGQYEDCLGKCSSAFESVLKVLRQKHGWTPAGDTLQPLLNAALQHTSLPGFFEQPLMLIGTMRNRLSSAHGGGSQPRSVERPVAQFALTSTAAAIVLLVHMVRP